MFNSLRFVQIWRPISAFICKWSPGRVEKLCRKVHTQFSSYLHPHWDMLGISAGRLLEKKGHFKISNALDNPFFRRGISAQIPCPSQKVSSGLVPMDGVNDAIAGGHSDRGTYYQKLAMMGERDPLQNLLSSPYPFDEQVPILTAQDFYKTFCEALFDAKKYDTAQRKKCFHTMLAWACESKSHINPENSLFQSVEDILSVKLQGNHCDELKTLCAQGMQRQMLSWSLYEVFTECYQDLIQQGRVTIGQGSLPSVVYTDSINQVEYTFKVRADEMTGVSDSSTLTFALRTSWALDPLDRGNPIFKQLQEKVGTRWAWNPWIRKEPTLEKQGRWVDIVKNDGWKSLSKKLQKKFDEMRASCPANAKDLIKPIRFLDGNAWDHLLSNHEILNIFSKPGYDFCWESAKKTYRFDNDQAFFKLLKERISKPPHSVRDFYLADKDIGITKMWCIGAIRTQFFQDVIRRATLQFAKDFAENASCDVLCMDMLAPDVFKISFKAKNHSLVENSCKKVKIPEAVCIQYQVSGSRNCDSDIDCSVVVHPIQDHTPSIFKILSGSIHEAMEALGDGKFKIPTRSSAKMFDINFYCPGFLRNSKIHSLFSPFFTITRQATSEKSLMDKGASKIRCVDAPEQDFLQMPRQVLAWAFKEQDIDMNSRLAQRVTQSYDYALRLELCNALKHAKKLLDMDRHVDIEVMDASSLKSALDALEKRIPTLPSIQPPLFLGLAKTLERKKIQEDQRKENLAHLKTIKKLIKNVQSSQALVRSIEICEWAWRDVASDYLADIEKYTLERGAVIQRMQKIQQGGDAYRDLQSQADGMALKMCEIQFLINMAVPEAYPNIAGMRRVVELQQMGIEQTWDLSMAVSSLMANASFIIEHGGSVKKEPSFEDFGQYLLSVAKYVYRIHQELKAILDHEMPMEKKDPQTLRFSYSKDRMMTAENLGHLAQGLYEAKLSSDLKKACEIANTYDLHFPKDMSDLCFKLISYADCLSFMQDEKRHEAHENFQKHISRFSNIVELAHRTDAILPSQGSQDQKALKLLTLSMPKEE